MTPPSPTPPTSTGPTTTPTTADDHAVSRSVADSAGAVLLDLRARRTDLEGSALKDAGDRAAPDHLAARLADVRPDDAVLSEEAADPAGRSSARRVWIIDPLDGTREFSEVPRSDWAVHVALWEGGDLVAGSVARPAMGSTLATDVPPVIPPRDPGPIRLAVSRTRPPAFVTALAERMDAQLVPMGSAGVKATAILDGVVDAYVHAGGQFEWDSAAPVAVARAAGLHTSRFDGSALVYNREDPLLPDLVICRPELAADLLAQIVVIVHEGDTQQ